MIRQKIPKRIKDRIKIHKRIKKQQKRKRKEKHQKKIALERKIYSTVWGECARTSLEKRLVKLGADLQTYDSSRGENEPKFLVFGRDKYEFIMGFSDWGSWGSIDQSFYLHKPSGWVCICTCTDKKNAIMSQTDILEESCEFVRKVPIYLNSNGQLLGHLQF